MDETLRKLQLTQLEILKVVDGICKKYNIRYSLYAGTLLGAVRHKGFIPWDDDLDICMLRKDYNRFIKAWNREQPDGYLLQNKENCPTFTQSFTKIRKEHTTFLQAADLVDQYHVGIFIDVFPVDRIPKGKLKQIVFQIRCIFYQLYIKEYIPPKGSKLEKMIACCVLNLVPKSLHEGIRKRLFRQIVKYNKNKENPIIFTESLKTIFTPLPANLGDEFIELPFENNSFPCFKQWDIFLRAWFDDYMQLPPEKERVGIHDVQIIDFYHDYKEHMALAADNNAENANLQEQELPIRVLCLFTLLDRGGAETMCMNLYRNIDRSKIQFDFLVYYPQRGAYEDEIESLGGRIYRIPHLDMRHLAGHIKGAREFFHSHPEYYIVHNHMGENGAFICREAKRAGVKTIIYHSHVDVAPAFDFSLFHGGLSIKKQSVDVVREKKSFVSKKQLLLKMLFPIAIKNSTDYFACGANAARAFGEKKSSVTILNNAIDLSRFIYSEERANAKKTEMCCKDKFIVGNVARINTNKNQTFAIEVLKELRKIKPNAQLLFIGEGENRRNLEKQIKDEGLEDQIRFLGIRSDVDELLQVMDVFLFPSIKEGLSVACIEAQAAGLPCVLSDGLDPSTIVVPENCRVLSLSESPQIWANTIVEISNRKRQDTTAAVRERGYDIKQTSEYMQRFYLEKCNISREYGV